MEILQKLGTIAGIAGIGLGVFVILFREVIRKSIFPNLTKVQGYKLLRLILVLTWTIAILGILGWLYSRQFDKAQSQNENFRPLILERKDNLRADSVKK